MRISLLACLIFIITVLFQCQLMAIVFPEERTAETDPFPKPLDGYVAEINPPGFSWLPVKGANTYKLIFTNIDTKTVDYEFTIEDENVFSPGQTLHTGKYTWIIEAYGEKNTLLSQRRPYHLTIPEGLPELPFPDIEKVLASLTSDHPKLIFPKDQLRKIRTTLSTTRAEGWKAVKRMADVSLNLSAPSPPSYGSIDDYNLRRLEYRKYCHYIRPYIDEGLQALSLAWLMTGDERYAKAAKRILFEIITWDPSGITSTSQIGFDEPGLSIARCLHRAYDWLYETFTEEERVKVRQACIERARDNFLRVGINRPFLENPGNSHDGRLIGYLCEQAMVLAHEAPEKEIKQWLEYSLKAYMTVFPHWGGVDGGWAEGIGYAATYNIKATDWIESCLSTLDLDLWKKPFFQKIRDYFLYCARPNDEFWPFGDGAECGPRSQPARAKILHMLMSHYAQRFNDPSCQWWADNVVIDKMDIENPITPLILAKDIKAREPSGIPNAKLFEDVGWCALHSNISDLDNDVFFLFKSSPYGSISHSHADQNGFYISVGGRALAIASGYYGPVYGMPHHAKWTRATKANNCVLINNQGQAIRDFTAKGRITDFKHGSAVTYVAGDAVPAYKGLLKLCDRHVIFVRPGLFVILDDLEAPQPSTYQWLIHALEKMECDENNQSLISRRKGAWLDVRLFNSGGTRMSFTQTDQFDTPYLEGVPEDYKDVLTDNKDIIPQWHFTASTVDNKEQIRIAAIMLAGSGEKHPRVDWLSDEGWTGARVQYPNGVAEVWAQLDSSKSLPEKLESLKEQIPESTVVIGLWHPSQGGVTEILFGN